MHIYKHILIYYIKSALGLLGLFSSRTPMEHHAHPIACARPSLETTGLTYRKILSEGSCATDCYRP
jgi:hypothetical protein